MTNIYYFFGVRRSGITGRFFDLFLLFVVYTIFQNTFYELISVDDEQFVSIDERCPFREHFNIVSSLYPLVIAS